VRTFTATPPVNGYYTITAFGGDSTNVGTVTLSGPVATTGWTDNSGLGITEVTAIQTATNDTVTGTSFTSGSWVIIVATSADHPTIGRSYLVRVSVTNSPAAFTIQEAYPVDPILLTRVNGVLKLGVTEG
jgi:hypothetical protein